MKRIFTKALCLVCAGALALSLAACGGKADSAASSTASSSALGSASDYDYQNFNYSDGLDEKGYWEGIRALDYVTLPEDFASVAIKRSDVEPTSEEVEEQISDLLSQYSSTEHITDRAAADGDTVDINYVGSVNNVEFTGGSAENYDLTLGSGTFIDGFEDQIIGHKPGETFDVSVTFPDGYSDSTDANGNTVTLSGQKAVFTVVLNYISERVLPELTDSWVASTFGTSNNIYTVEALRAYYQDQLYTSNLNTAVMDDLLENSTFKSIPQQVMDYQVNQCLNYYSTLAGYYGYDLDGLVQNLLGYENTDAMLAHLESNLEDYSKEALLYQAVAESLDITPTQEQLDAYSDYKDTYGQNYCTMVALMGLGANTTDIAIYPRTSTDSAGADLTGQKTYTLHFDALPPTVGNGFWSVTAYGEDNFLIDNPISRYCVNDRSGLHRNPDGSIDVTLSKDAPEDTTNWLPVSDEKFHLFLRIYKPDWTALDSFPPPVISVK